MYTGGDIANKISVLCLKQPSYSDSSSSNLYFHSSTQGELISKLSVELLKLWENAIAWISQLAPLHRSVSVLNQMCLYAFTPLFPWGIGARTTKPSTKQGSHQWSCPAQSSGPHTAGVAQQGQPHASLVRSSCVTSAFSNLYLSNLWHYRELPAVAMLCSQAVLLHRALFSPDAERKHIS